MSNDPSNAMPEPLAIDPILIVEDNLINQLILEDQLTDLHIASIVANNGQEALAMLCDEQTPQLSMIFMDCMMPLMDGYEATRRIRAGEGGERYQSIPIIAMTGNVSDMDRKKCLDAGMSDYYGKPLNSSAIEEAVRKWSDSDANTVTDVTPDSTNNAEDRARDNEGCVDDGQSEGRTKDREDKKMAPMLVWDEHTIRARELESPGAFDQRLDEFDQQFSSTMDQVRMAFERKQWQGAQQALESIQSMLVNLVAMRAKEIAKVLGEQCGQGGGQGGGKGSGNALSTLIDELNTEAQLARTFSARAMGVGWVEG